MKAVILLFLFALIELIIPTKSLKCGDYEIENCISCNSTNKNETCGKCKDKHFLFFNDLLCLPCDHPYYGQFHCGGNCDGRKYIENRMPICEEGGCKEGYIIWLEFVGHVQMVLMLALNVHMKYKKITKQMIILNAINVKIINLN